MERAFRKGRRAYWVTRKNGAMERRAYTGRQARALVEVHGLQLEPVEGPGWPNVQARRAAAVWRAGYHRWAAARGFAPSGRDGLSGVEWSKARGGWGPDAPAPSEDEARALGRALSKASARFWLARAAEYGRSEGGRA